MALTIKSPSKSFAGDPENILLYASCWWNGLAEQLFDGFLNNKKIGNLASRKTVTHEKVFNPTTMYSVGSYTFYSPETEKTSRRDSNLSPASRAAVFLQLRCPTSCIRHLTFQCCFTTLTGLDHGQSHRPTHTLSSLSVFFFNLYLQNSLHLVFLHLMLAVFSLWVQVCYKIWQLFFTLNGFSLYGVMRGS